MPTERKRNMKRKWKRGLKWNDNETWNKNARKEHRKWKRYTKWSPPNIRTLITSRRPTRDQMDTTMENHRNMQQRIPGYHSSPSDVRPRYQERPTGDAGSTQRNGSQQPTGPREPGKIHDWTTYTQVKNSALTLGPASLALKYYPGLSRDIFPRLLVFLSLVSNTFFFSETALRIWW